MPRPEKKGLPPQFVAIGLVVAIVAFVALLYLASDPRSKEDEPQEEVVENPFGELPPENAPPEEEAGEEKVEDANPFAGLPPEDKDG